MMNPTAIDQRTGTGRFERLAVADAMHRGVVTCPTGTSLRSVARMMAEHRIHAVVVFDEESDDGRDAALWGVVSDLDLVKAASAVDIDERTAGGTAVTPIVLVEPHDTLTGAVQLMTEHEINHLVVVGPQSQRPVAILSTLDVARALAEAG